MPVFRSGEEVKVIHTEDQFTEILKTLKQLQNADVENNCGNRKNRR